MIQLLLAAIGGYFIGDALCHDEKFGEGGMPKHMKMIFDTDRFDAALFMEDAEEGKDDDYPYEEYYYGDYEQDGNIFDVQYYPHNSLLIVNGIDYGKQQIKK